MSRAPSGRPAGGEAVGATGREAGPAGHDGPAGIHASRFVVRSYELDILGHVNNAVYLNWLEQARLEAFRELGYDLESLIRREWLTNVVRIEIDYRREARHGDAIRVTTEVERIGRSSITLRHRVEREADPEPPVAEARVVVVWLGADGRPAPVPDEVRRKLEDGAATP